MKGIVLAVLIGLLTGALYSVTTVLGMGQPPQQRVHLAVYHI